MDIEKLAMQAGMETEWYSGSASCVWTPGVSGVSAEQLKAFAAIVTEECAKVCDQMFYGQVGAVHVAAHRCAAAIREKFKEQTK